MLNVNLRLQKEDIQLDTVSDEQFSAEESISEANEILQSLRDEGQLVRGDMNSDTWVFNYRLCDGYNIHINLKLLPSVIGFNKKMNLSELELMIKCWAANLLNEHYPAHVQRCCFSLIEAITFTCGFRDDLVESLVDSIINKSVLHSTKGIIINAVLNFIDYTRLQINKKYISELLKLQSKLKLEPKARTLPSIKDILTFSSCLERYYNDVQSNEEILLYYPLLLWWKVTPVIPMRPSEYCHIARNSSKKIDGICSLKLPRKKQPKNRVQIIDTVRVTEEINNMIQTYISLSETYGPTDTLISHHVMYKLCPSYRKKLNRKKFNRLALSFLLKHFYEHIVFKKYGETVEKQLCPMDTRHLAFCSLRLQGFSPVEIARLGNHSTIEAQYHYTMHPEYFIKLRVKALMDNFKLRVKEETEKQKYKENDSGGELPDFIINKSLSTPISTFRHPLDEAGYCTDKEQRCQSKECLLCDYWWIPREELSVKQNLILKKLNNLQSNIYELTAFITNLHKKIKLDNESPLNPMTANLLQTKAQELDGMIHQLARLKLLEGET